MPKLLRNVERALQIHDKEICFTKLFKLHLLYVNFFISFLFFSELFLFFLLETPWGSLKEVVNREDMYH